MPKLKIYTTDSFFKKKNQFSYNKLFRKVTELE